MTPMCLRQVHSHSSITFQGSATLRTFHSITLPFISPASAPHGKGGHCPFHSQPALYFIPARRLLSPPASSHNQPPQAKISVFLTPIMPPPCASIQCQPCCFVQCQCHHCPFPPANTACLLIPCDLSTPNKSQSVLHSLLFVLKPFYSSCQKTFSEGVF
jgi:hypothetical protein